MRKMTLLEMVQNIASALDTDEINSITDTVESLQIAEVVKETYYEQFNNIFVPELRGLVKLEDVSSLSSPNYLKVPSDVRKIEWIKYKDIGTGGRAQDLDYIHPHEFLNRQLQYSSPGANVFQTTDPISGITYFIQKNAPPTQYTLFDDEHIAFNSFDSDAEATVHSANSIAFGWKSENFQLKDTYIPPIDGNLFPLLLAEAKSTCFINLKQISSSKEEQKARRQRIRMQNDQFHSKQAQYSYWNRGPNFARHR